MGNKANGKRASCVGKLNASKDSWPKIAWLSSLNVQPEGTELYGWTSTSFWFGVARRTIADTHKKKDGAISNTNTCPNANACESRIVGNHVVYLSSPRGVNESGTRRRCCKVSRFVILSAGY